MKRPIIDLYNLEELRMHIYSRYAKDLEKYCDELENKNKELQSYIERLENALSTMLDIANCPFVEHKDIVCKDTNSCVECVTKNYDKVVG